MRWRVVVTNLPSGRKAIPCAGEVEARSCYAAWQRAHGAENVRLERYETGIGWVVDEATVS